MNRGKCFQCREPATRHVRIAGHRTLPFCDRCFGLVDAEEIDRVLDALRKGTAVAHVPLDPLADLFGPLPTLAFDDK